MKIEWSDFITNNVNLTFIHIFFNQFIGIGPHKFKEQTKFN